jgi:cell division septal protein FtsQ
MQKFYRRPHRYKRKKPIFRSKFFRYFILLLFLGSGIFYLIYFSSFFQVKEIEISGNQKVSSENIRNLIEEKLKGKVLSFSTRSIFSVNLNQINALIMGNFPQISRIDLKINLPHTIIATVEERKPIAVFSGGGKYFFLDKEGIIFEEISEPEKEITKIKNRTLTDDFKLGEKLIEKGVLSQILKIESELKSGLKIPIKEFIFSSEDKLTAVTEEDWEIYLNLKSDVEWQMTKLRAVLEEKIPREKRGDLEYIELRFGNFAPFKYRD